MAQTFEPIRAAAAHAAAANTAAADPGAVRQADAGAEAADDRRWHELVSQVGAEIAAPLTAALERIHVLTSTGKIDRLGLRALRDEVEQARQVGMIGQQLTRFASGRLHQSPEAMQLDEVLKGVLAQATRRVQARGLALRPQLNPAKVTVDPALLFGLLNTTLDWALANASGCIDFSIDAKAVPGEARLVCTYARRSADADEAVAAGTPPRLDSLTWRLIEQTAWTMGLRIERLDVGSVVSLTVDFPRAAAEHDAGVASTELDVTVSGWGHSNALAGRQVLVVASRREMRLLIRDALRDMNLLVDMVGTVDEAASFCREGLPHAIVIESIQLGARFAAFREEIVAEVPDFVFIVILEQGSTFEMAASNSTRMARVGRDVVESSLPAALVFELAKGG